MVYGVGDLFIRLVANMLIVLMALPFVFDKISPMIQEKTNEVVVEEISKFIAGIKNKEKYIGYFALVICALLFAVVFK